MPAKPSLNSSAYTLSDSPGVMAELPAWFATLTPSQLKGVWVAAVIEAAYLEHSITHLSAALAAVRDHGVPPRPEWPSVIAKRARAKKRRDDAGAPAGEPDHEQPD